MPVTSESPTPAGAMPGTEFTRAIVATDGTPAGDGALRVGHALAQRDGTVVTAVSIVEPVPYPLPVSDLSITSTTLSASDDEALDTRRRGVAHQYERLGLEPRPEVAVTIDAPLPGILTIAAARHADLLIVGLGRHAAMDHLFGSETALQAVREADIPVLAVPGRTQTLPRHALVGTDFDGSSVAAARAAAQLIGPEGHLTLVHVDAVAEPVPAMLADWPPQVLDRLNDAFARQIAQLGLPPTMQVDTIPVAGQISRELVTCAQRVGADVLVVGRHERSLMERMVLGSVATRVIRTASCAVLVVPRPS